MNFCDDFLNNLQLNQHLQEGEDYIIFNDQLFQYFYGIYGGTDIRRLSIPIVHTEYQDPLPVNSNPGGGDSIHAIDLNDDKSDSNSKESEKSYQPDPLQVVSYCVEVCLRKIKVIIAPLMDFFPNYKGDMPFTVFVSRRSTIAELQLKLVIAFKQMNGEHDKDHPVRFLLEWSRMWTIDWNKESIEDLPRLVQDCTKKGKLDALPLQI